MNLSSTIRIQCYAPLQALPAETNARGITLGVFAVRRESYCTL